MGSVKFKRYDELKKGDKIWFYGYKAFVRDIKENGIVNDKNNIEHLGENYGGVASRTVGMRK